MATGKRVNRKSSTAPKPSAPATGAAADHYHREKARRAHKAPPESEAMAAARREYLAMLEAGATSGKRGRPRKVVAKPKADLDEGLDELGEEPGTPPDADDEVDTGTAVDEIEEE
jgi:hypothetical protein